MKYSLQISKGLAVSGLRWLTQYSTSWLAILVLSLLMSMTLNAQNVSSSSCNQVLVTYDGRCDDPSDSFSPKGLASCISFASSLAPTAGPDPYASCLNNIICIQSQFTDWDFSLFAGGTYTLDGISADFLFPVSIRTAGGPRNGRSCSTISYAVDFYKNGILLETISGSIGRDVITTTNLPLSKPVFVKAGDNIRMIIRGQGTTGCSLFELAGLKVIGCCGGTAPPPPPPTGCTLTVDAGPNMSICPGGNIAMTANIAGDASCLPGAVCTPTTLVTYSGSCDDPSDCLLPRSVASCISTASGICPTNGPNPYASCNNNIICIASSFNDWDFSMTARNTFLFQDISADFWYPTDGSNAGGSPNSRNCPTNYTTLVKFFLNGGLVSQQVVNVSNNQIITKVVRPTEPILVNVGSTLRVVIDGQPSGQQCDLFELAGLRVNGCCSPTIIEAQSNNTYAWSGPGISNQTNPTLTTNTAGTYTVVVTDCNGCTATDQVVITVEDPTVSASVSGPISCENPSVQLLTTSASGVSYAWSGPNGFTSNANSPSVSVAGVYSVTVTSPNGCIATDNVTVVGFCDPTVRIGNYVFIDANENGIQDIGEVGVPGVDVQLLSAGPDGIFHTADDVLADATTTDANGNYNFDVQPGTYCIRFVQGTLPANFVFTTTDALSNVVDLVDSDADASGKVPAFTITSGQADDLSFDAGIFEKLELPNIGDRVFNDLNNNGIQETGEPGVPGVGVQLISAGPDGVFHTADDIIADATSTDANGNYLFQDVPPGQYCIQVLANTIPANFEFTVANAINNGVDLIDSDADAGGKIPAFTVVAGQPDDLSYDAGIVEIAPPEFPDIGNFVFNDLNMNGIQDAGEPGVPGVGLQLITAGPDGVFHTTDDMVANATTTDANGNYIFMDVPPGQYCIQVLSNTIPADFVFTTPNAMGNVVDQADSDTDAAGKIPPFTVVEGQADDLTFDAGIYEELPPVLTNIGDLVFNDLNKNGIQEAGEPGVPGVNVQLISAGPDGVFHTGDDQIVDATTTDANGNYLFQDVAPGQYCIQVVQSTIPTNFVFTTPNALGNLLDQADSDADAAGKIPAFTVVAGQPDDLTFDAGIFEELPPELPNIGDLVFNDLNMNGIQEAGEPGVPGVNVQLISAGPDGVFHTGDDQIVDATTTDANGNYLFQDVAPGQYCIQVVQSTIPTNFVFTTPNALGNVIDQADSDADAAGKIPAFTVVAGQADDLSYDAGIVEDIPPVLPNIGDRVFNDLNNNGIQEAGEPGVPGVSVQLISAGPDGLFHTGDDQIVDATTTDANGNYLFQMVNPGQYCIQVVQSTIPPNFVFTIPNAMGNVIDQADSDADAAGKIPAFTVVAGQADDLTYDAGIVEEVPELPNIGNFVFNDLNNNGVQEAGEPGVPGVGVQLISAGPDGVFHTGDDQIVDATTTDVNGNYLFQDVDPGQYCIQVVANTLPADFIFTTTDALGNLVDQADSDADAAGKIPAFNVVAGQADDLTYDAGIVEDIPPVLPNIGDKVFTDLNNNGIQDPTEPGVPGVGVQLISAGPDGIFHTGDDQIVDATTTDANGNYLFQMVNPGQYCIQIVASTLPANDGFTTTNAGSDNLDSDADASGKIPAFTVVAGQPDDLTYDAGILPPPVVKPNLTISDITVNEEDGTATLEICLDQIATDFVYARYTTMDNSAQLGTDYVPQSGFIFIPQGLQCTQVILPLVDDNIPESTEEFKVILSSPFNADIADGEGIVTILDSDEAVCEAQAGTLSNVLMNVPYKNGSATLVAIPNGDAYVPAGFIQRYVLTSGEGLVIESLSTSPLFTVTRPGKYTIHSLVFDPATLDLGIIVPGQTTGVAVNGLLEQGGGTICASLDVPGTMFMVEEPVIIPTVVINDVTVYEEDGIATLDICIDQPTSNVVSVRYTTSNGSAITGSDYQMIDGVATINPGEVCTQVTFPIFDDATEEPTESFVVNLTSPTNVTIADPQGTVTILDQDQPAPVIPNIVISDVTVYEEDGIAVLDICIDQPTGNAVSVRYTTGNGSAFVGSDYQMIDGVATINPGEVCTQVTFPILDDSTEEPTESFVVNLTSPSNAVIVDPQGTVTILDQDQPTPVVPNIVINAVTVYEEDGIAVLDICIDQPTSNAVSVRYTTANGSAFAGSDYQMIDGVATINPGEVCTQVTFPILDDTTEEPTESFVVNLTSPTNAAIAEPQGTVIILDIDKPVITPPTIPNLTINDVTVNENEGYAHLNVCLDQPAPQDVLIECITVNGTAIGGEDFVQATDVLTIPAGQTCHQVSFKIIDDNISEETEYYFIDLSNAIGANIVDSRGQITILDNDSAEIPARCPELSAMGGVGTITVNGLTAPIEIVQIFNTSNQIVFQCVNNCNGTEIVENLPAGDYVVKINCYNKSWNLICNEEVRVTVTNGTVTPPTSCESNITNGGRISGQESICGSYDAGVIGNESDPYGGADNVEIEYLWLSSTTSCPTATRQQISGEHGPTYNPGVITETTYFARCARRKGCSTWVESNCIIKEVFCGNESTPEQTGSTPANAKVDMCEDVTITYGNGEIEMTGSVGQNYYYKVNAIDQGWAVVHGCSANCGNTQTATGLADGKYLVTIYDVNWAQHCRMEITLSSSLTEESSTSSRTANTTTKQVDKKNQANLSNSNESTNEPTIVATNLSSISEKISLYPNPAVDVLTVNTTQLAGQSGRLYLSNNIGQVVKEVTVSTFDVSPLQLQVGTLPSGLYHLTIVAEGQLITTKKVMIRH